MSATKIGRNDACPCGSGRKYKKCCQAADDARRAEEARAREAEERARPTIDTRDLRDDHDGHVCTDPSHHHGGRRRARTPARGEGAKEVARRERERALEERMDLQQYGSPYAKACVLAEQAAALPMSAALRATWPMKTPAHVAKLSTAELERALAERGVDASRAAFVALAQQHRSAFDLARTWVDAHGLGRDAAVFAGLAAHNLWLRHCPERPSTERFEDLVEAGEACFEEDEEAALERRLEAWTMLRGWLGPAERTLAAAEAAVPTGVAIGPWTRAVSEHAVDLGLEQEAWRPRAIDLLEQLLAQFPDEPGWDDFDLLENVDYRHELLSGLVELHREAGDEARTKELERTLEGYESRLCSTELLDAIEDAGLLDDDELDDEDDDVEGEEDEVDDEHDLGQCEVAGHEGEPAHEDGGRDADADPATDPR